MRHTPHHGHHRGILGRHRDHRGRRRQREGQRLGGRGHRRHRHTMAVEDSRPVAHTPRHSEGGGGAEAGIIIRSEDTHRHARHAHRHRSGGTRRRHHAGKAQPQVTDAPQRTLTHWHTPPRPTCKTSDDNNDDNDRGDARRQASHPRPWLFLT